MVLGTGGAPTLNSGPIPELRPMLRLLPLLFLLLFFAAHGQDDAHTHLDRARVAYLALDLPLALAHADSAIALDAAIPGGYKLRGDIKQRDNNLHGALVDYTRAEKEDDSDPRLYVSRSAIYITEGRLKDAFRDTDRAIKLDPEDPDAWYNRACASYMGRNNEGALRDLDRALKLRPDNADALFLRGVIRGEIFKEAAGLEDIEAALAMKPEIPGGKLSAAILLYELERFPEAIERFTEVIDAGQDLKEAYYYRADCHYRLDDKEAACADWIQSASEGDRDAIFIVRNYCNTDETKIPKKPVRKRREIIIEF